MAGRPYPEGEWSALAKQGRWSTARLDTLETELSAGGSTAFMIVDGGEIAFQWGDIALRSSVASVRKSLINVLYGIYVDRGTIDLQATLADMEIDDIDGLTAQERQATVADLLKSRSGIYHPSVYGNDTGRPTRGSHPPGAFWFYNNWDFNALGSIFERQTGESLFAAFEEQVARPLGMQDISAADCRYQTGVESNHPVYKMRLSARDLARVGLLYLRHGLWGERRIVSEDWVRTSIAPHSDLGGGRGYGYLWWSAEANAPGDSMSAPVPIFYASGFGGQYVVILPDLALVVVHRSANVDHGITHDRMGQILRLALSAKVSSQRRASNAMRMASPARTVPISQR